MDEGYGDFYISSYDYVIFVFDCVIRLGFYFGYLEFKEKIDLMFRKYEK